MVGVNPSRSRQPVGQPSHAHAGPALLPGTSTTPAQAGEAEALPSAPPRDAPEDQPAIEKVAVLVCHGMGQQRPFQTLEGPARAIVRMEEARGRERGAPAMTPRVVRLCPKSGTLGDADDALSRPLERIEIMVTGRPTEGKPTRPREVHLYEAYWAPLTEGKVTSLDVAWFFAGAGGNGLLKLLPYNTATRRVFGKTVSFGRPILNLLRLLGAWLIFLSLLLILVVIGAVAAARFATAPGLAGDTGTPVWPPPWLMERLTRDIAVFDGVVILLGMGILVPQVLR